VSRPSDQQNRTVGLLTLARLGSGGFLLEGLRFWV